MNDVKPYVYKATNIETGEYYYGSRWANTVPAEQDIGIIYFSSCEKIKKIKDQFTFEIMSICSDKDEAFGEEQLLIYACRKDPLLINGHWIDPYTSESRFKACFKGKKHTSEAKAIIKAKRALQILTPERNKKVSESNKGKKKPPRTKKHCESIRKSKTGAKYPNFPKGKNHPMFGRDRPDHSQTMTGKGNPKFDPTIYRWINIITGQKETCTKYELRTKYNLNHGRIGVVARKIAKSHKGWTLDE